MRRFAGLTAGLVACVVASAIASLPRAEQWEAKTSPKAVVELFTSQGCSSCVAADKYFAELAERPDVVAISLHVDYWDYLGWRDTLSDPAYTERQRSYAAVHGSRRVYTPQIIMNGTEDFVGSERNAIDAAIEKSSLIVPVMMKRGNGKVVIEVAGKELPHPWSATIRLVLLTSEAKVAIARGENAGATIDYYNIVRAIRPVGMWDGTPVKITLPEHELMGDGVDSCAIIVQEDQSKGPGAIIGAAWLGGW